MTIEKDNGLRGQEARVVKQIDGDGADTDLTLLVSTDAMDDEGDVVEQNWSIPSQVPFLFAHNNKTLPVGHIVNPRVVNVAELPAGVRRDLSEDAERATVVDVNVDSEDDFAEAVLRKYRRGDMEDSSVGFDPDEFEKFEPDEPGRFHFMQSTLKEVSATPIGANDDTTVLRKAFDPDVIPEQLMDHDAEDAGEPTDKGDAPEQTKEGRRNSKMDEKVQEHIKECAEYLKGDREAEDVKMCPLHKMGDHDDKAGADVTEKGDGGPYVIDQEVGETRIRVAAPTIDEAKSLLASLDEGDPDQTKDDQRQDDADEPEGDGLRIDGEKIIDLTQEKSEEPDISSGEAGDGDTSELTIDEMFAQ